MSSTAGSRASNKSNPRRPRSVVWNYFDKIPDEPYRARCRLCGSTCHHANNTSNLFKHLRVKHPTSYKEAEVQRDQEMELYLELKAKAGQPVTRPPRPLKPLATPTERVRGRGRPKGSSSSNNYPPPLKTEVHNSSDSSAKKPSYYLSKVKDRQNLSKAFLCMLAQDMEHPSIVNRPGFRDFVASLDSRFELPAKKTITKTLLPELVEQTKHKIKLDVVIASYFALSVETWTYKESQLFVTLSAHFIKDSWEMCSIVLETFDSSDERTENDTSHLKRITDEWGISERVVALMSNSVNEVVSSESLINGWEELTCFGHTINQIMLGALNSVPELVRIQKKASEAVTYFDTHTKASDTLAAVQQQHNMPCRRLKQESRRFWTSTVAMFERVSEQYEAVNTVLCFLGHDLMCLCDDEVELIKCILEVLRPFQAATKELCTEPYTCVSKLIPIATLLQQVIGAGLVNGDAEPASPSGDNTIPQTKALLKDALTSHMQQHLSSAEHNYRLAAATLLDPRFKQHAFTDPSALEAAQQRLLCDVQAVVQSSDLTTNGDFGTAGGSGAGGGDTASFWGMFDKKVVDAGAMKTDISEAENETRRFFKEANIPRTADPFQWWKLNEVQFPSLKILAKRFLCVPATAVNSSRMFSKSGDEFSRRRDLFKPSQLNNMIFLNKNLSV